jgi:methylated-DNA-protein-cysteine methyltransferase-like protein
LNEKRPRSRATQAGRRAASATPSSEAEERVAAIHAVVRAVPRGRVATYGEVALLAGMPAGHRFAARALATCPSALPWYRIVGKQDARRARIAIGDPEHAKIQRRRLAAEGITFDANGFIPLARFGMLHDRTTARPRRRDARSASRASAAEP